MSVCSIAGIAEHEWGVQWPDPGWGQQLQDALCSLVSTGQSTIWVVLLPPLVWGRRLNIEARREDEVDDVIRRDAQSLWLGNHRSIALTVSRGESAGVWFATATDESLVAEVERAADDAGMKVLAVESAYSVLARSCHQTVKEGTGFLVADFATERAVLHVERGRCVRVERSLAGVSSWIQHVTTTLHQRTDAAVCVMSSDEDLLRATANATSLATTVFPTPVHAIAAATAQRRRAASLVTGTMKAERQRRAQRWKAGLYGAATALVLLAGAIELVATQRAIGGVKQARDAHASQVRTAVAARDSLRSILAQVSRTEDLRISTPDWAGLVARLAVILPGDAQLLALRATGDSLTLEVSAAKAADVYSRLERFEALEGVHLSTPIRARGDSASGLLEFFTVEARVRAGGARGGR